MHFAAILRIFFITGTDNIADKSTAGDGYGRYE